MDTTLPSDLIVEPIFLPPKSCGFLRHVGRVSAVFSACASRRDAHAKPFAWCQVGLTSEAARVLLALAWLVRVDDCAEHR